MLAYVQFFATPPGSSVRGIPQARILQWVAISFPRDLPNSGIKPVSPAWQVDSSPLSHQGSVYICIHTHTYIVLTKGMFLRLFLFIREYARKGISHLLFNLAPCDFLPSSVKMKSKSYLGIFPCISFQSHREFLVEGTCCVLHLVYCYRLTCYGVTKFNNWHFFFS